jgi:uncharacterized Zn-finger protein
MPGIFIRVTDIVNKCDEVHTRNLKNALNKHMGKMAMHKSFENFERLLSRDIGLPFSTDIRLNFL